MKMFTFQFNFTNKEGKEDEIQFCGENKQEAKECFLAEGLADTDKPVNIEVVYNKYDAEEYGDMYGTPTEYPV